MLGSIPVLVPRLQSTAAMHHLLRSTIAVFAVVLAGLTEPVAQAAELVMFETASCPYCRRWHREIGPIYPKTPEARRAPLRRVDLDAPRPPDLTFVKGVAFTPTFVLVEDGREIGRFMGYGGDEQFWTLLAELMGKLAKAERPAEPGRPN